MSRLAPVLIFSMLAAAPFAHAKCDGVEAQVGTDRQCLRPKDTFKDCPECPEMVVLPAGDFMMGSDAYFDEKPVHRVEIGRPFAVAKFEVTFAEWDACAAAGGCQQQLADRGWGRGDRPATNLSWNDATNEYLPWLSRKTGKTYRLLTEAEWEYAARGVSTSSGEHTNYFWGDDIGRNRANCKGCGSRWDDEQTASVGSFSANAFGLHDLHGNVWEWVQDCYKDSYANAPPNGRATAEVASCLRVIRGGSWYDKPQDVRSAKRSAVRPVNRYGGSGFRVARTL